MTRTPMGSFDPFNFPTQFNTTVGFDPIVKRLAELAQTMPKIPTYPPFNIKKVDETKYVIEMAVAGFGKQDIEIELQEDTLTVKGSVHQEDTADDDNYLFKGIAERPFTRTFTLADTVQVKNADLINGMLKIWLERFIPEEKQPKKIPVGEGTVSEKQLLTEKK
jgi:molecular chaperone IbpA